MYHALLTNRYLTTRVIPFIAVAAVALCVALVIIVVSVMTGFLDMVRSSGRKLMGDVVISYPVSGVPYYERLIALIEELPDAEAASPVIDSWGLLRMPYPDGPHKQTETVQVWGIEPESFSRVTGYDQTLHWRAMTEQQWDWVFRDALRRDWPSLVESLSDAQKIDLLRRAGTGVRLDRLVEEDAERQRELLQSLDWEQMHHWLDLDRQTVEAVLDDAQWQRLLSTDDRLIDDDAILDDGLRLRRGAEGPPGIVTGIHVSEANERKSDGSYEALRGGYWWMPRFEVALTVLPIMDQGFVQDETRTFHVVNEFLSGVFLIDDKRVMVPLSTAQEMLHLDEAEYLDDEGEADGVDPARVTMILVRAVDGVAPADLRAQVEMAYEIYRQEVLEDESARARPPLYPGFGLSIQTWEEQQAPFIGPIEKERELMRTLFSLVYLVCAGLVLSIFWAIVYEKTRDIGILRSVGASRMGISWIFLRYGLVIGVVGAIAGLGLAYLIVHNINLIHNALGDPPLWLAVVIAAVALVSLVLTVVRGASGNLLPIVLGILVTGTLLFVATFIVLLKRSGGIIIWDPSVYYFTHIPNEVDLATAVGTMIGAVIFSLIGAFLPAAKAADVDPVKALRYE